MTNKTLYFFSFGTIFLILLLSVSGCSSFTSTGQYYDTVVATAEAHAKASQAKYDALAQIAASGDGQAASAAVMALALTQTPTINPVPQQSTALQWASVMATPITSLGMMWMQADSAKTMSLHNRDVSLARVTATSIDNQALYGSFVSNNEVMSSLSNVDYTPFVDGLVTLGTVGLNTAENIGIAGLSTSEVVGTSGITGAVTLGTEGLNSNVTLGTAGLDSTVNLGTAGLDSTVNLGSLGLTSTASMGLEGLTGITNVASTGMNNMLTIDTNSNSLISNIWTDYTEALNNIMSLVPPVICTPVINADGTTTINCD